MILELLSNPLTWTMALFVVICAWHNFKVGYKQGVAEGVDVVLEMLNAEKLIDLETGANGEVIIHARDGSSRKKAG